MPNDAGTVPDKDSDPATDRRALLNRLRNVAGLIPKTSAALSELSPSYATQQKRLTPLLV